MDGTITYAGLGLLILFCLAVAVGIYLIITMRSINTLVKNATKILADNEAAIQQTAAALPVALNSVNDTTLLVKEKVENTEAAISIIGDTIVEKVAAASESAEDVIAWAKIAARVIRIIIGAFQDGKK